MVLVFGRFDGYFCLIFRVPYWDHIFDKAESYVSLTIIYVYGICMIQVVALELKDVYVWMLNLNIMV